MCPPESVQLRHSSSGVEVPEKKKGLGGNPIIDAIPHIFSTIYRTFKMKKIPKAWLIAIWSNSSRSVEWNSQSWVSLHAASAGFYLTRRLGVERRPCEGNAVLHGTHGGDAPWQGPTLQVDSQQHEACSCRPCANNTESWAVNTGQQLVWTAVLDSYTPSGSQPLLFPQSQNAELSGPWVRPKYIFIWTTWVCF